MLPIARRSFNSVVKNSHRFSSTSLTVDLGSDTFATHCKYNIIIYMFISLSNS